MPEMRVQVNTIDEVRQALELMKEHGFLVFDNTPDTFSGESLNLLRCNTGETALEFTTPSSGASLTVSTTEVFSGTSPTSMTDLDLSSVVGSNAALVALAFRSGSNLKATAVRTNGDTNDYYDVDSESSA